jgi:putative flippase GtrA
MDLVLKLFKLRAFRFIVSGGTATLVTLLLLYFFIDVLHMWYLSASVIAYIVGFTVSFILQKLFTFNDFTRKPIPKQTLIYFSVQLSNLCLNTFLMYVCVELLKMHYILSQIILAGIVALYSFFIYRYIFQHIPNSNSLKELPQEKMQP